MAQPQPSERRRYRRADARNGRNSILAACAAAQRLQNYEIAARLLDQRGALRDGLTIDQAAAAIFAIGHPETYRTLVLYGSWDDHRWAAWAQGMLEAALLKT